jgi:hypothetical protein
LGCSSLSVDEVLYLDSFTQISLRYRAKIPPINLK